MKGLILAGGHATRLHPTTKVVNKHLLMIYDRPMIFYAISTMKDIGVTDIIITLGDHDGERFYDLLGSGKELGVNITYHYHGEAKGIAYAINSSKEYLKDEAFIVILGDNIFANGLVGAMTRFKSNNKENMVVLKQIDNCSSYGVASIEKMTWGVDARGFYEKSLTPPSNYAVLGAYFLQPEFFKVYDELSPSGRGEYEITDALNKLYPMTYEYNGEWFDCGTFDDIFRASEWRRGCLR